mmetsp:Transcript_4448/g.9663  ORF Transcript_4448/g.9663 Transcript_4448/m.9663 type:complete len:237 (+) Transcript_4448:175-885(+)
MRVHVNLRVSAQPEGAKLGNTMPPPAPPIPQRQLTAFLCRADSLHLWLSAVAIFLFFSGALGVCYSMTVKSSAVAPGHMEMSPPPPMPVRAFLRGLISSASRGRIWADKHDCLASNVHKHPWRIATGCEGSNEAYFAPTVGWIRGSSLLRILFAALLGITLQAPRPSRCLVAYALAAWSGLHVALRLQEEWLEKSRIGLESDLPLPWLQITIFIGSAGALALPHAHQRKMHVCKSR